MDEDNSKEKKNKLPQKKTGEDITGKIPEKIGLSPVQKIIFDKFGDIGLGVYTLIDGQKTADEIMRDTGLTECKLVMILDFMDEQGIIRLDYPKSSLPQSPIASIKSTKPAQNTDKIRKILQEYKDLMTVTVEQRLKFDNIILSSPFKVWKKIDDLQKESGISKSHVMRYLKAFEEKKAVLLNNREEFMKGPMLAERLGEFNTQEKRLYDKFGVDAVCLCLLLDDKAAIQKLRKSIPNATEIIKFLEKDGMVAIDPYRKTPVLIKVNFTGASLPLMYDKATNKAFGRAMRYYEINLFTRAEEEFTKLIQRRNDAAYLVNRGSALYQQKKLLEAIADFTRVIELDRENHKAFYNRGISYFEKADYETAIADLTRAIQIKPDFAWSYYMRGFAIESIGKNIPDAIADFEKALQLQPDFEGANKHLEAAKAKRKLTKTTDNDLFDVVESIPKVRLSDVGGMAKLKNGAISGILYMLKEPDKVKEFGIVFGGGVLLYGPPGCGKSFVTEAIAGEANANSKTVFIRASIAETMNKYIGNSEKNLHNIFEYARARQPAIIFFDEMEALGGAREDIQEHWGRAFVNQFLIEMDQIEKKNEQVLVFGATNSPWFVDYALRRSGRFTEKIFIGPPDEPERKEIFKIQTRKIAPFLDVDYDKLAKATDGFSGADIQALCKDVARNSLVELSRTNMPRKMSTEDFVQAIEQGRKEGKYNSIKEWLDISKRYDKTPPKDGGNRKEWTMFG